MLRNLCITGLVVAAFVACGSSGSDSNGDGNGTGASSGSSGSGGSSGSSSGSGGGGSGSSSGSSSGGGSGSSSGGGDVDGSTPPGTSPVIAGCSILPANHVFNTPIDALPVDKQSSAYLKTIGSHPIHLDLGTTVDPTKDTFYGIPYNVVHGGSLTWTAVSFSSTDPHMSWDPTSEADCAVGAGHTLVAPCTSSAATSPTFPIPASPIVEWGIDTDPSQPYGDHHLLMLDADTCQLWELYHVYPDGKGSWDIFGAAHFDLKSNALRPAGWTSADAAGFPILPLLLRADEASTGTIHHALRFTIDSAKIRTDYIWPARHLTNNGTASTDLPPMGQLFRIKSSYVIPSGYHAQSKAILQAMKTYGMYIADGGSDMYVTGEPSAAWADETFTEVQSVGTDQFEAVDVTAITSRPGFDASSAAVP